MGKPYGTIEELAAAEKINSSYSPTTRMTLLALEIVEAALKRKALPRNHADDFNEPIPD